MDLSQYSDDELNAMLGESQEPDLSQYSDDDLMAMLPQETPQQAPTQPPEQALDPSMLDKVGAYGRGLTRATMGGSFADEVLAVPATMGTTAIRAARGEPIDMAGDYQSNLQSIQRQFKEDEVIAPYTNMAGQIAGDVRSASALVKGAGKLAPSAIDRLAKYARKTPYTRVAKSAGTAGLSGYIYELGDSEGDLQERHENGLATGLISMPLGPIGSRVGQSVSPLLERASKLFLPKATTKIDDVAQALKTQPNDLPKPQMPVGERIRLPQGAKSGDVNIMRSEEAGRQGLLGNDYQVMMNQVDDAVKDDAVNVVTGLAGKQGTSDDLLEGALSNVQKRFKAQKTVQSRLMDKRNDAIAKTKIYNDYTKDTLVSDLAELKKSPDFEVNIGSNPQIKEKFDFLNKLTKGKGVTDVKMSTLAAWRRSLNQFEPRTQESVLAGQMAKTYDNWLDNIATEAFKAGDEDVVKTIFSANKEYSKFKNLYGTDKHLGQSKVIQDIVEKSELTPDHLVNMTFGKSLKGTNTTNQVVGRLLKTMPEGARREAVRNDMKAGLLNKAIEGSYKGDQFSMAKLRNNIFDLKKNRAFKDHLASKEEIEVLDTLLKDMSSYIDSTSRRDVYSPSGPLVLRGLSKVIGGVGFMTGPVGGRMATEPLKNMIKEGAKAPDRRVVEQTIKQFSDSLKDMTANKYNFYGSQAATSTGAQTINDKEQ